MFIQITTLEGETATFDLEDVGNVYPSDDVIYFNGPLGSTPCHLSTARPVNSVGKHLRFSIKNMIATAAERYCNDKKIPANPFNIVSALAHMGILDPKAGLPEADVIYDARQGDDVTLLKELSNKGGRKTYIAVNLRDQDK